MEGISTEFMVQMMMLGFVAGLVFALRKVIAWVILILAAFIAILYVLDGPVRNSLNDTWEGSGDSMMEWVDDTLFFWVEEQEPQEETTEEETE